MFTGLIREIGVLRRRSGGARLKRLQIHAPATAPQLVVGDSLAVNGICLTVIRKSGCLIEAEAAAETLRKTTLATWRSGRRLHLEPALRAGDALGGHFVLGHVDGTGTVIGIRKQDRSLVMTVRCGGDLARWLLPKGSVAVDGVSLTLDGGPHSDRFAVNLVPHTLRWTLFESVRVGDTVNLEMDALVKAARTGKLETALVNEATSSRIRLAPGLATIADSGARIPASARGIPSLDHILARGFHRKGVR